MGQVDGETRLEVRLDETSGEANGAAYLVHMLLFQQAEADGSRRFAREGRRLKPVRLLLTDTGEGCAVSFVDGVLVVTSDARGSYPTAIRAQSRHVLDVTQLQLIGRFVIVGPIGSRKFWGLLKDITTRKVVIKGLLSHYVNTMRFLWLVNVRGN